MLNIRRCISIALFLAYILQIATSACLFPTKEQIPNGRYVYRSPMHALWMIAPENYPLHFRCSKGFTKRGAVTSYCRNGRWTRSVPKCLEIKCPHPPEISNGIYTLYSGSKDFNVGTIAIYECDPGHFTINSAIICTLYWNDNKVSWDGITPECISKNDKHITTDEELKCPDPPALLYGDYILNSGSNAPLTVGTTATYTCDSEFEFDKSTDSVLTCTLRPNTNEVFWKGTTPDCICKEE